MGKLSKYTLAFKGLGVGTHEFKFDVDDSFFACFDDSEILKGTAEVNISLTKQSNMLTLDFNIEGEVMVVCDRCLDEFMIPVDYQGTLWVRFSEEEKEDDADIIWINPCEQDVNLAQYIYESICLSLPYQRVHPEDENGKSTCNQKMLEKFQIVSEDEFEEMFPEEPEEGNSSWAEQLSELKNKMEKE